jgi:hypothetical protein
MARPTIENLRGLAMSAAELREKHPDWDDAFTSDYLDILANFVSLAEEIDTKNDIIKNTTRVTPLDSPYQITSTDEEIFFDTDTGGIIGLLPPGSDGTNYRCLNVGEKGFDVTLVPSGSDLLFGVNGPETIYDDEVLVFTFETSEGWF